MGRRRNRNRGNGSTIHQPARVDSLIAAGQWREAATAAQSQLAAAPTDELRRQLATCLLQLADYKAAAALWQSTTVRLYDDRFFAGMCLCTAKEWETARLELEACIQERDDADALYWLARAIAQGKRGAHELADTYRIIELLNKARRLKCRNPDVYLWLERLESHDFTEGKRKSEAILEDGLAASPESWQLRDTLAHRYTHSGRFQDALDLLRPILDHESPSIDALWTARECEEARGNLPAALNYFDRSIPAMEDNADRFSFRLLRGDLLMRMGRHVDAIGDFRAELVRPNVRSKSLANLALAHVHVCQGKHFQAWTYARNAVDCWVEVGGNSCLQGCLAIKAVTREILEPVPDHILSLVENLESHATEAGELQTLTLLKYWAAAWANDADGCLAAARQLSPKRFPFVNFDWSIIAIRDGDVVRALRHYLTHVNKFGSGAETFDCYRIDFCGDEAFNWDRCFKTDEVKAKVEAMLYDFAARHQKNKEIVAWTLLPLYRHIWRRLLWESKSWDRVYEVAGFLHNQIPTAPHILFDYAFAAAELKHLTEAEKAYRQLIEIDPAEAGALHNLSLLIEPRSFAEALALQRRAVQCDPKSELKRNRLAALVEVDERRKEEVKRQEDFLKTARDRWPQIDYFKKKLLGALTIIEGGFDNWAHLARLTGIDEKYLPGHWRKLVDDAFIIEDATGYHLNEHVIDLIKQERSHAVTTTIVRADSTIAFKPVFNSKREYDIYHILIALFPNHFVLPNMSLQSIFQYDRMKEVLESTDFDYYMRSQVDFCITSTSNYLPIIAFEIDSSYHDDEKQVVRDQRKNRIFQKGGVNLLRLRPYGRPSEGGLRSEIVKVVRQFGKELRETAEKTEGLTRLTLEIDFDTFGFDGGDSRN